MAVRKSSASAARGKKLAKPASDHKRCTITKRPYTYKGTTKTRWVVTEPTNAQGKRPTKTFRNERHAEAYAAKVDRDRHSGVHVADRDTITFGQACEAWFKKCEQRHQSRNRTLTGITIKGYRSYSRYVLPVFGRTKLNKITSRDVQAFVDDLATRLAGSSCTQIFIVIWNVLEYAVNEELLARNPLKDRRVKLPEVRKVGADDIPSFEDIRKLLLYLHAPRPPVTGQHKLTWAQRLPMVALPAFAGLRVGECAALDWSCVDLARREIRVVASYSPVDGIKGPKSKAGVRTVPMNPILHNILLRYAALVGTTGPVFRLGCGGARRCYDAFGRQLNASMDGAGVSGFSFHGLRHFAGSAWLAQGMRIQDVSWLLGHSQITTTMGTYAHQLKGDDHARQVLQQQVTRFPGIPHSLVTEAPVEEIVPLLPALTDGTELVPVANGPIYEPVPLADVPAIEAVPTVDIPPEAPQWLGYFVRLLQAGWQVRDAAKEVGYDKTRCWRVCKNFGLDSPEQIRLAACWARAQYLRDHGFSLKEASRICGVRPDSISRKLNRFGPKDRSAEKRSPRLLQCRTCGEDFLWAKPGTNPHACPKCKLVAGTVPTNKALITQAELPLSKS